MNYSLALAALAGCAYQPGSFAYPQNDFPGQRTTVGCLDVAVERRTDLPIGPVLGYQFANRCDHPTMVDLGAVAVIGRNAQGTEVVLRPYDPRTELHPVALDGRNVGAELLAYPADRAISQVCVDVATLVHRGTRPETIDSGPSRSHGRNLPAGRPLAGEPRWVCLAGSVGAVVGSLP